MIVSYPPEHFEVYRFRCRIFEEDLGIPAEYVKKYDSNAPISDNKFAFWYSDEKFLNNSFDRVLIFYHEGKAVSMCAGTIYNKALYRGVQMYYILKSARFVPELNTLHFKEGGFFDRQITRAHELGLKAVFISIDIFDQKHANMYKAMLGNRVGFGHLGNSNRKYTRENLNYLDGEYMIMHTPQKVCYFDLNEPIEFDNLFYEQ